MDRIKIPEAVDELFALINNKPIDPELTEQAANATLALKSAKSTAERQGGGGAALLFYVGIGIVYGMGLVSGETFGRYLHLALETKH